MDPMTPPPTTPPPAGESTPPTGAAPHFVCTGGCGGTSTTPGVCTSETCPKHGTALTECSCTDGTHAEVKAAGNPSPIIAPSPDASTLTPSPMPTGDASAPPAMPEPAAASEPQTPVSGMPDPEKPV